MPNFTRYIGIDYSGAETPSASLKRLRVYSGESDALPVEVSPPPSPANIERAAASPNGWSKWLAQARATPVGIDHGFSFPLRYFEDPRTCGVTGLCSLDDFQRHWPTDEGNTVVDFVCEGIAAMVQSELEFTLAAPD